MQYKDTLGNSHNMYENMEHIFDGTKNIISLYMKNNKDHKIHSLLFKFESFTLEYNKVLQFICVI